MLNEGAEQKRAMPVCSVELRADRKRLPLVFRFQILSTQTFGGITDLAQTGEEWAMGERTGAQGSKKRHPGSRDRWSSGGAAEDLGTNVNFGEQGARELE